MIANKEAILHRSTSICHGSSPGLTAAGVGKNYHLPVFLWKGTDCSFTSCCLRIRLLISTHLVSAVIIFGDRGGRQAHPCILFQPHSNDKITSPENKTKLPVSLWNKIIYTFGTPTLTTAATQRMGTQFI